MGGLIKKGDGTDRNGNSNKWEKHKTLRPSVSVCGGLCNMEKHITICLFNENEEKRSGQRYHHNKGIVREMSRIGLRNVFSRRRKSVDTPSPLGGKVQEVDDRPTVIQCAEQGRWGKCFEEVSREPSSLFDCDGQGQTLLHFAASSGNLSATQELLARGLEPSPDNWGWTPLHCASHGRYLEGNKDGDRFLSVISLLLESGSDKTAKRNDHSTFLHHLASWSLFPCPPIFFEIFKKGLEAIDINDTTQIGETFLHKAASAGNGALITLLLEEGADPNVTDQSNQSPLHYAASFGDLSVVESLLDAGSPLFGADKFQRTAYDIAFLSSHFEVSFFLRNLMEKQGGPIVLPNPLTVSRDNTYSPFDHIDAMVSMMGRKGQNYSSTSLLPYAKLSSRSASHLRSSFRENKAKKIAKSFHHDSAGPYPVPRKFINFDRVDHGPSPLAQECPTSPMRSAPAHVVPSRNPLHDTIDTILTGSHDCDPFSDSFEEAGGPPAELSGSLSGNLVGLMVEEEDDEEDLCYDETGSKDPPKQPKDEPDLKPLSKEREESESIRPLVYLSKIGKDGSWIVEVGSQSLGALRPDHEFCLERTDYDDFYFIRNFVANKMTSSQVVTEMEENAWETLKKTDFIRQTTFIGKRKGRHVIISVRLQGEKESLSQLTNQYRALLRTSKHDIRFWLSGSPTPTSRHRFTGKNTRVLLEEISNRFPKVRELKEVKSTQVLRSLVAMECFCSIQAYTVPVLLVTKKQSKGGILYNQTPDLSPRNYETFRSFLSSLGTKIDLQNWSGYRGNVSTSAPFPQGQHAIFSLLHCRPVLIPVVPWFNAPPEEFLRGCTTVIVYVEKGAAGIRLPLKNGGYIHSYLVVREEEENHFTVQHVFACSIGRCKPTIPQRFLFSGEGGALAEFLLFKVINADRAASFCRDEGCLDVLRRRNRQSIINAIVEGSHDCIVGDVEGSPNLPHHAKHQASPV